MYYNVIAGKHVRDYVVWLKFEDGTEGEIDLASELWGPVFEPLKDVEYFSQWLSRNMAPSLGRMEQTLRQSSFTIAYVCRHSAAG